MKKFLYTMIASLTFVTTQSFALVEEAPAKMDCLSQLLVKRYSGYSFDASRPVSHDQLNALVEAARMAPSSYNEQPWNYLICDRNTDYQSFNKVLSTLVEGNQKWAKNAPILIVAVASSKSAHNGKNNRWAQYDTGAASMSLVLEAASLGLMGHQMGGFDETKLSKAFAIPADYVPMAVIAIGYASPNEVQPEKKRKPVSSNFFNGSWGHPFE